MHVRISFRVATLIVVGLGLSVFILRVLGSSERVLGWIAVAATLAALLTPPVEFLHRWMPRGIAAILVLVAVGGPISLLVYGVVDDIARQTSELNRETVPKVARAVEDRFDTEDAGELDVERRIKDFVNALPRQLAGGRGAEVVRANTTRFLAVLATTVLTIFLILSGPQLVRNALKLVRDERKRTHVATLLLHAYKRGIGYAYGSLMFATLAGLYSYTLLRSRDFPAPTALAAWVGLTDFVPVFGAIAGWLPIFAIAAIEGRQEFIVVFGAFVIYQSVEALLIRRYIERRTMHIGVFLPAVSFLFGLEFYGLGGALIAMFSVAMAVAGAKQFAIEETELDEELATSSG